jgi:exonuclease VII small subunit
MKCLCGYNQKPDNAKILKSHLEDCLTTGYLKDIILLPVVTWRNGLTVVEFLEEGEVALEMGIKIQRASSGVARLEKIIGQKEAGLQAILQHNLDKSPEEIIEAIEKQGAPVEAEAVKESPAPKKKSAPVTTTARKKKSAPKKKL